MNSNNTDEIVLNKGSILTTRELYKKTKEIQSLEILKIALGFLISTFIIRILDNLLLNNFQNNKILYSILLILILFIVINLSISLFTNIKINNDKEELLKKLTT